MVGSCACLEIRAVVEEQQYMSLQVRGGFFFFPMGFFAGFSKQALFYPRNHDRLSE